MDVHDLDVGIFFQVFAQLGNIHIHTSAVEISITAPDLLQRYFTWQQIVLMLAEHVQ